MNYQETIEYLFNSTPVFEKIGAKAYKPGLQTTEALDEHFGHPHHQFKTIHVAGTNGKGSTCAFITSVLREAGYSCGLFTSPHLVEINERFQINEEVIDDDTFLCAFEKVKKLSEITDTDFVFTVSEDEDKLPARVFNAAEKI